MTAHLKESLTRQDKASFSATLSMIALLFELLALSRSVTLFMALKNKMHFSYISNRCLSVVNLKKDSLFVAGCFVGVFPIFCSMSNLKQCLPTTRTHQRSHR